MVLLLEKNNIMKKIDYGYLETNNEKFIREARENGAKFWRYFVITSTVLGAFLIFGILSNINIDWNVFFISTINK